MVLGCACLLCQPAAQPQKKHLNEDRLGTPAACLPAAALVEKALGVSGDNILYVGDHIYTDAALAKLNFRWAYELPLGWQAIVCTSFGKAGELLWGAGLPRIKEVSRAVCWLGPSGCASPCWPCRIPLCQGECFAWGVIDTTTPPNVCLAPVLVSRAIASVGGARR
jgi:hypothetical protein